VALAMMPGASVFPPAILPPYARRCRSLEVLIPILVSLIGAESALDFGGVF
jgi:hypothetical protein